MSNLRSKLLRPWVVMPLVAVLTVGGYAVTQRDEGSASTVVAVGPTEQVVAATSGSMAQTITAEGTVAAAQTDDLSFAVSGQVTAVNVAAGDAVVAGQVLATIDSAELEANLADAEATLAEAEATYTDAVDSGASDAQVEVDLSAVTTATDRLASAQEDLAGARLVATFDGTVASVDLTVGEELSSGGTSGTTATGSASGSGQSAGSLGSSSTGLAGPGAASASGTGSGTTTSTPQIRVVSSGRYTVDLSVDDSEVTDLAVGQLATVTVSTGSSSAAGGFGGMPGAAGFGALAGGGGFPGALPGAAQASGGAAAQADAATEDLPAATASTDAASTDQALVTEVGAVADASSGVASYPVKVRFDDASGEFVTGTTVSVVISYAEVADAVQVPARAVTTTDGTSTVTVRGASGDEERTVQTGLSANGMVQITEGLAAGEQVVIAAPTFPTGGAR